MRRFRITHRGCWSTNLRSPTASRCTPRWRGDCWRRAQTARARRAVLLERRTRVALVEYAIGSSLSRSSTGAPRNTLPLLFKGIVGQARPGLDLIRSEGASAPTGGAVKIDRRAVVGLALGMCLVGVGMLAGVAGERMRFDHKRAGVLARSDAE